MRRDSFAGLSRFKRDIGAATALEYALIAGGISIVIVAAVALLGGGLSTFFGSLATALGG